MEVQEYQGGCREKTLKSRQDFTIRTGTTKLPNKTYKALGHMNWKPQGSKCQIQIFLEKIHLLPLSNFGVPRQMINLTKTHYLVLQDLFRTASP